MTTFVHIALCCLTCLVSCTCAQGYWPRTFYSHHPYGNPSWPRAGGSYSVSSNCFKCTFLDKKCPEGFDFEFELDSTECHAYPCRCVSEENEEAEVIEKEEKPDDKLVSLTNRFIGRMNNFKAKKKQPVETDSSGCDGKNGCIDGDILVSASNQGYVDGMKNPPSARNFYEFESAKWPQNTAGKYRIPYAVTGILDSSLIVKAMEQITSSAPCFNFVERNGEQDYIDFIDDGGCYSYIGRIGGRQPISIGSGCMILGTIQHEIMHALGFLHEHTRPDRDDYVIINYENIKSGSEGNFNKYPNGKTFDKAYDYGSVLHYWEAAFSANGKNTIVAKDTTKQDVMGQRSGLSSLDVEKLLKAYPCTETASTGESASENTDSTSTCADVRSEERCQELKSLGKCQRSRVMGICAKTCNVCTTSSDAPVSTRKPNLTTIHGRNTDCFDIVWSSCKKYANKKKCDSFGKFWCRKSCHKC